MATKNTRPAPAPAPADPPADAGATTTTPAVATQATVTAPAADGFAAPTVYADAKNGGSGNLDFNDPDD